MNKICTSLEQSKKLIELGIDVNTADMYWSIEEIPYLSFPVNDIVTDWKYAQESGMIPAWSISALLELITPGYVLLRDIKSSKYKCIKTIDTNNYDNPLDAAFEMVCWLLENGKL